MDLLLLLLLLLTVALPLHKGLRYLAFGSPPYSILVAFNDENRDHERMGRVLAVLEKNREQEKI